MRGKCPDCGGEVGCNTITGKLVNYVCLNKDCEWYYEDLKVRVFDGLEKNGLLSKWRTE